MKAIVIKRTVKRKQIENIWEAIESREAIAKKHPNSNVEIERTAGGGMHSYRIVISDLTTVEVPAVPELEPLPHPEYKPRTPYYGNRNRPDFGDHKDFLTKEGKIDHARRREIQNANGTVYQRNRRKLAIAEGEWIAPQLKGKK